MDECQTLRATVSLGLKFGIYGLGLRIWGQLQIVAVCAGLGRLGVFSARLRFGLTFQDIRSSCSNQKPWGLGVFRGSEVVILGLMVRCSVRCFFGEI